ncbi:MAG TPA: hypothetical protein VNJ71_02490 [Gemmatimonadales bacterium]|jgi:hypothetical protein|nr:hypothetical protein [Gemmatimonadales bacterium]
MQLHRILTGGATRGGLFFLFLAALAMVQNPLQAMKQFPSEPPLPEPNCASGRLLCRIVTTCIAGYFDNSGKCTSGQTFSIYYYYRDD